MRALAVLLTLAVAGPAAAQPYLMTQAREAQAAADADTARYRDLRLTNQLSVLQARLQADQALGGLQASRAATLSIPAARGSDAPSAVIDASKLMSIPDEVLAQSNARILAAAGNRR
jgi:hypothetical protein